MEDFLSRFTDSLLFEHTNCLFFLNSNSSEDANDHQNKRSNSTILETSTQNPNPSKKKPSFQESFFSHISQSVYDLTINSIYPDYKVLIYNIRTHNSSLKSQLTYLFPLLHQQLDKNKGEDEHLEFFMERYHALFAGIEKTFEYLETHIEILEKKLKLDRRLMDLKLMDSSDKASMEEMVEWVHEYKIDLKELKMEILSLKKFCDSKYSGLLGVRVDSSPHAQSDSTSCRRILQRFSIGNSSIALRFCTLAQDDSVVLGERRIVLRSLVMKLTAAINNQSKL